MKILLVVDECSASLSSHRIRFIMRINISHEVFIIISNAITNTDSSFSLSLVWFIYLISITCIMCIVLCNSTQFHFPFIIPRLLINYKLKEKGGVIVIVCVCVCIVSSLYSVFRIG